MNIGVCQRLIYTKRFNNIATYDKSMQDLTIVKEESS